MVLYFIPLGLPVLCGTLIYPIGNTVHHYTMLNAIVLSNTIHYKKHCLHVRSAVGIGEATVNPSESWDLGLGTLHPHLPLHRASTTQGQTLQRTETTLNAVYQLARERLPRCVLCHIEQTQYTFIM